MAFPQAYNDPNQCIYLEDWIKWTKIQQQNVQKMHSGFLGGLYIYIYIYVCIFLLLLLVIMLILTVSQIFCPIVH